MTLMAHLKREIEDFFVDWALFSRQNRRMQEQNASKALSPIRRFGVKNSLWSSTAAALLLGAALVWLVPHCSLPTASWRDARSTLPWDAPTLRVEEVKGVWKSSKGHARMELRAAYYPVAEIGLGEAQGAGMLYVRFTDPAGHQVGDTINLHYKDGAFLPREDVNIHAAGAKATAFIEAGYDKETDFHLHEVDENSPLWRVKLFNRGEGEAEMHELGSVTIPAEAV